MDVMRTVKEFEGLSSGLDGVGRTTFTAPPAGPASSTRSLLELTELLADAPVVAVCESNSMRNVGDHWSAVGRTVAWVERLGRTISLYEAASLQALGKFSPLQGKLVIVGGSGLVGPGRFETCVESIFAQRPASVALWGIGHNYQEGVQLDPTTGWRRRVLKDGVTRIWPEWLGKADVVGVRDWDAGMPWVPCASCMLPAFDLLREREPEHEFVVLNHYERGIDTSRPLATGADFEHITNNTEDILETLTRLASAKVVVSNSYHALYWALMLGRGAVSVAPNSTRFHGFRWPVSYASQADWPSAVEHARPAPEALGQARAANVEMSRRVLQIGRSLGLVDPREAIDPAEGARVDTLTAR
ncbi:hypothetical protein GCM10010413_18260 [Promicromonospora sukumoe]|uniref:Polysaccharide pyruvyl transferase WcaK-like protein n=1 Tax=Promicromonospora sukumoe TaxID=88382 RepID=A0A7W3J9V4_9MICO|nr:hypothetical protein [Promicromonospora sukumoe]MBA8808955.1 hypothetical protein [Promicromonospora sukumoe]